MCHVSIDCNACPCLGQLGGAITSDLWTDGYKNVSYLTVTAHYVSADWELKTRVLSTKPMSCETKTAENITKHVENVLHSFDVSAERLNHIFLSLTAVQIL